MAFFPMVIFSEPIFYYANSLKDLLVVRLFTQILKLSFFLF